MYRIHYLLLLHNEKWFQIANYSTFAMFTEYLLHIMNNVLCLKAHDNACELLNTSKTNANVHTGHFEIFLS